MALVEIAERLAAGSPLTGIRNLWLKDRVSGKIEKNPVRPVLDINALPLPDYDLFADGRFYRPMAGKVWKLFPVETSRGCPYSCTFCNSPATAEIYDHCGGGRFFRKKTITRLEAELTQLVERWQVEYIYFLSDTLLAMNDAEFDDFCRMYEKFQLPFWCQNRPEMVSELRMRRLKSIGCHRMSVGVEHGNEAFRRQVLHKRVSNEKIIDAMDILARVGIPVSVNNMIGFPGETRELAWDTIKLNRQLRYDTVNAYAFTPFHGTELYRTCLAKGYLSDSAELKCLTKGSVLSMPQFTKEEIDGLVKTFALYARLPEKYFPKIVQAEKSDPEGERVFAELRQLYISEYFK